MSMDFSLKKNDLMDKKLRGDKSMLNDSVQNTQTNTLIHEELPFDDEFSPPRLDGLQNSSRMTQQVVNSAV